MKYATLIIGLLLIACTAPVKEKEQPTTPEVQPELTGAKKIVAEMIEATGGRENFYNLGSVTYDFEYRDPVSPITLVGKETYDFDGELSYATYKGHSLLGGNGKVVEGYDGSNAWVTFNGKISDDEQANGIARFLRKTNYYWFAMYFKLLDDGVNHELIGSKTIKGQDYDLVKVTFEDTVGDAQDTYVLYINKATKLVDQFLFTIIAFGIQEPSLMRFEYETINGIKIGTKRKYIKADWEGNILGEKYVTTTWQNVRFDIKPDRAMFARPGE